MQRKDKKLGFWLLVFIGLGSMIGSGIFNSPKDLIQVANPQANLLAWAIGGFGALTLALVFVYLSVKKPELKSGIFAYARDGFGDYMGFNAAWGYWSIGWLGNVGYLIIFFKTLNDLLGKYALSPIACFVVASGLIWAIFFILKAGIREGAALNFVVTLAKLLPIILVVAAGVFVAKPDIFFAPDWTHMVASSGKPASPFLQIGNAMAIILWCFVGVESASVLSARAKNLQIVRKATIVAIVSVLIIYIAITSIAMAVVPASELAMSDTPLALMLEKTALGMAGSVIVKLGIMVSVMGASISWILLSVETMYSAAKSGVMPRLLTKENKNGTPMNALFFTQIFTQIFLLSILLPALNDTYVALITLGTTLVLIPYLLSSVYALKIAVGRKAKIEIGQLCIALFAAVYSAYTIYAVGFRYLFYSLLFYALGTVFFFRAKMERREAIKNWEWLIMCGLVVASIILLIEIFRGDVQLF
jgi:arginine:ornithine antiporter/lysine permease